jgi:von Willebrand factor type A domain
VLVRSQTRHVRTDAELYVVLDTSRSMAASESPRSPTREERAKRFALAFRAALPEIPAGVASFTNRILPHLVPASDPATFDSTIAQAIGVDRPPPSQPIAVATSYNVLSDLIGPGAFAPRIRHRLLVLLTDGESQAYSPERVAQSLRSARTGLIVVRFWRASERVFVHGVSAGYLPTSSSIGPLADLGRRPHIRRARRLCSGPRRSSVLRLWADSGARRTPAARCRSPPGSCWLHSCRSGSCSAGAAAG